jgi:adenosylcobyric acid synthase
MKQGHGGNLRALARQAGVSAEGILDFSANINPLGPPECVRPVISRNVEKLTHYPDVDADELVTAIAQHHRIGADQIIVGNGSTEILYALTRSLGRGRAVIPAPSYIDYASAAKLAGMNVQAIPLDENDGFALNWRRLGDSLTGGELVILGRPNNPTGVGFDGDSFRQFAAEHPDCRFVVDEAFIDFVEGAESLIHDIPVNTIVLRSLTKFYAIPGLRVGFAVAPIDIAAKIAAAIPPWSISTLAQAVGSAVLPDEQYAQTTRHLVAEQREYLQEQLSAVAGLHVYPGQANFLLVRTDRRDARTLADKLLEDDGIAVRVCDNYEGLDERFFRLAVRTEQENAALVSAIKRAIGDRPGIAPIRKKTPAIMFQGTSSNAGKSVLAAALCRILFQDGVRVAPFKSQNMSLNSFVTRDGCEMGRAQVVQAQACRLDPDVRMNPILLKPNSDTGSQVIVNGKVVGNMPVAQYIGYKPKAFAAAQACYDSLAGEFDAVVLEGAGSPAEVNLKHHDIVNMAMASYAKAPVLLTGDIDRGGVFASFVGTMELLNQAERRAVAGVVINRFRGDATLLGPAIDYVRQYTGKPTFGVVPYIHNLGIPEEDSVEFKSGRLDETSAPSAGAQTVDIAVIDLPHISNFTDLDPLRIEHDVHLRIVRSGDALGRPDAVIIPGSKSVLGDLAYLQSTPMGDALCRLAGSGKCEIVGICGGFQMLGKTIADPFGIESGAREMQGLGLLDIATSLAREKTLNRATAVHVASGLQVSGYEIHHGQTTAGRVVDVFGQAEASKGVARGDGMIWGSYLHGVFDADEFRRWFIDGLRQRKGLARVGEVTAVYDIDAALDRLAGVVRQAMDMKEIYRVMGL